MFGISFCLLSHDQNSKKSFKSEIRSIYYILSTENILQSWKLHVRWLNSVGLVFIFQQYLKTKEGFYRGFIKWIRLYSWLVGHKWSVCLYYLWRAMAMIYEKESAIFRSIPFYMILSPEQKALGREISEQMFP